MQESTTTNQGEEFILRSRSYLSEEYLPKILTCLDRLTQEDLWWRPNSRSNSVGNLVLHLAGNVRQWVVSGIAGQSDIRERDREFGATEGWTSGQLAEVLEGALTEVDEVLAALDPDRLGDPLTVQGLDTTVLGALFHAVEHFSGHTAQISYLTKMRTGEDLGFYHIDGEGRVHTRWRGQPGSPSPETGADP